MDDMPQGHCKMCMADRFFRPLPKVGDDEEFECAMCKNRVYEIPPPFTVRGDPPKKKKKQRY